MLVRQYHPDINPDEAAVEQFIKINDAYTILSESIQASEQKRRRAVVQVQEELIVSSDVVHQEVTQKAERSARVTVSDEKAGFNSRLQNIRLTLEKLGFDAFAESDDAMAAEGERAEGEQAEAAQKAKAYVAQPSGMEKNLKQDTYQQLKGLLRQQKFPRAIALVEGLAHRMPQDSEIVQWQAIVYQRWGRKLISEGQTQKARIYLKKALRTDPNNRSLWREVNRDFWQLASLGN